MGLALQKLPIQLEEQTVAREQNRSADARMTRVHERCLMQRGTGISSPVLQDALIEWELGRGGTQVLLALLQLARVAWADGKVDDVERRVALLEGRKLGASPDSLDRLLAWLTVRPDEALLKISYLALVELLRALPPPERSKFAQAMIAGCRAVALASGGLWGVGRISWGERSVLATFRKVLGSATHGRHEDIASHRPFL